MNVCSDAGNHMEEPALKLPANTYCFCLDNFLNGSKSVFPHLKKGRVIIQPCHAGVGMKGEETDRTLSLTPDAEKV